MLKDMRYDYNEIWDPHFAEDTHGRSARAVQNTHIWQGKHYNSRSYIRVWRLPKLYVRKLVDGHPSDHAALVLEDHDVVSGRLQAIEHVKLNIEEQIPPIEVGGPGLGAMALCERGVAVLVG